MKYDLILQGGHVVDPAQSTNRICDVAFSGDRVAALGEELPAESGSTVVDCSGKIVCPGLIDLHVHVFPGVSHYGIEPDPHCIAKGVTTAVDAGSAGADTFPGFRKYVIDVSATRILAHINISAQGMLDADIGELQDIRFANVERALGMIEQHRDVILGVKVRLTRDSLVSREAGIEPLHRAREAADAAGLPIMVHPQDAWCDSIDDILAVMRKGDILTHCFHDMPCGIMEGSGRVRDSVFAAIERGVLFDVGHGQGSFSWKVAESALEQSVLPHTISSDLHIYNVEGPVYDLATTVSKFLYMGVPLEESLNRVTAVPAEIIGMAGSIGTLAPGAFGDAVVLELEQGSHVLTDSYGETRSANRILVPALVVRGGTIYRSPVRA